MKFKTELKLDKKFDVNKPPKGAWIQGDADQILLGASTVNYKFAFAMMFIFGLLIGYSLIRVNQIEYSATLLFIFAICTILSSPFLFRAVMALGGKVVVIITEDKCKVFRGVGIFGISKTVDLNTLSIKKKHFMVKTKMDYYWELKSKNKTILTQTEMFSSLEEDTFMYLIKSIQKIMQDKNNFLPEDLSEHLI